MRLALLLKHHPLSRNNHQARMQAIFIRLTLMIMKNQVMEDWIKMKMLKKRKRRKRRIRKRLTKELMALILKMIISLRTSIPKMAKFIQKMVMIQTITIQMGEQLEKDFKGVQSTKTLVWIEILHL